MGYFNKAINCRIKRRSKYLEISQNDIIMNIDKTNDSVLLSSEFSVRFVVRFHSTKMVTLLVSFLCKYKYNMVLCLLKNYKN